MGRTALSLEALGKNLFPRFFQFLELHFLPSIAHGSFLHLQSQQHHVCFHRRIVLCPSGPSPLTYKGTNKTGQSSHAKIVYLITSLKSLLPHKVTHTSSRDWDTGILSKGIIPFIVLSKDKFYLFFSDWCWKDNKSHILHFSF